MPQPLSIVFTNNRVCQGYFTHDQHSYDLEGITPLSESRTISYCHSSQSESHQWWNYLSIVQWCTSCHYTCSLCTVLRSAVGKTHVLRSRLVMDYTTSYFPYSEIDHLHLCSEAQCVSHLLPLGDCHTGTLSMNSINQSLLQCFQ